MGKKGTKRKTRWRVLPIGDDGSEDEEGRDEERGNRERHWKPRPRYHQQHHQSQHSASGQEKRTFNEDEYTRITTPRQDVLFKKGYLGRKRTTEPAVGANGAAPANGLPNDAPNGSTNGDPAPHSGESMDADCGEGSDMMDDQAYYYPGPFVDPATGVYYMNGGYEMYDPYTGALTVVVGPGPGMMGLPPMGLPPIEWFNPRLPPPPHGAPPHMPHMQSDYCYMHGRKRYSVDSQVSENCSGPSSESAGSGPPSGPPSSPQDCDSGGLPSGPSPGPSPGPPPLPPMGPLPYPPHPHYMYPYMFGAPLYSLDGVSVQGGPPYGPICDVNVGGKRRKKKRRRKRRRGGGTDDGSEESSSEDNQVEEGDGAGPSSLSGQSEEATPTDSDAFPEFVPKATAAAAAAVAVSTLNGDASAWEPSILTPPQTPTACVQAQAHPETESRQEVLVQPAEGASAEAAIADSTVEPSVTAVSTPESPPACDVAAEPSCLPLITPVPAEEGDVKPLIHEEALVGAEAVPVTEEPTPLTPQPEELSIVTPVEVPEPAVAPEEIASEAPVETVQEELPTPSGPQEEPKTNGKVSFEELTAPFELSKAPVEEPKAIESNKVSPSTAKSVEKKKKSSSKVNGEVLCVSKKAADLSAHVNGDVHVNSKVVSDFESLLTLDKVPVPNGDVICFKEAVEPKTQAPLPQCIEKVGNDYEKDSLVQRTNSVEVILNNNKNDPKLKGKANHTKNAVNEGVVNGDTYVNSVNGKVKVKNNSCPDHRGTNGFAGKTRLSASPSRDVGAAVTERSAVEQAPARNNSKSEPKSKGQSTKKKSKKGAPAKTDLSSNAGESNGVMAPPAPPDPTPPSPVVDDSASLSLRPDTSLAWGRRNKDAKQPRPVDDVLLQALVGTVQSTETNVDIPAEGVSTAAAAVLTPVPTPVLALAHEEQRQNVQAEDESTVNPAAESTTPTEPKGSRLTPSAAAHRPNRTKKWRQNPKERAPTPGRELTASSSSLSSSDETEQAEDVIFVSPLAATAATTTTAPAVQHTEERESPLRLTEAVTAWLRDHETEEVLVPAVDQPPVSDSESELDESEAEDDETQPPKNAIGNPFRAPSHSSICSTTHASAGLAVDVEERVAAFDEPEAAWDTLCDPSLFVAKYYRLAEDPQETMPPVVALELRHDVDLKRSARSSASPEKVNVCDQHDSGVHSDESGDEHQTPTKDVQAQAEEFAAKSAYLLRQLKAQSPGVPCGGICCALQ